MDDHKVEEVMDEEPYVPLGPDPLLSGKKEMWFAVYEPDTGALREIGNAFGQAEYDMETESRDYPCIPIDTRIDPLRDYRVNLDTLELEHVPGSHVEPINERDVDKERDKRINAGFWFNNVLFQARDQDIRNINGAATAAAIAVMQQAAPGDLRWANPDKDFEWIAYDNSTVPMDAYTTIAFGMTAMSWVSALTMAARDLKNRMIAGEEFDITDDELWPQTTPDGISKDAGPDVSPN